MHTMMITKPIDSVHILQMFTANSKHLQTFAFVYLIGHLSDLFAIYAILAWGPVKDIVNDKMSQWHLMLTLWSTNSQ